MSTVLGEPRWRVQYLARLKKQGPAGELRRVSNPSLSFAIFGPSNCFADYKVCGSTPVPNPLDASSTQTQQVSTNNSCHVCQVVPWETKSLQLDPAYGLEKKAMSEAESLNIPPGDRTSPGDPRGGEKNEVDPKKEE